MTLHECLEHIPRRLTPEMERYATDVVFLDSRYIFATREGRQQFGYCTHCNHEFAAAGLRHNHTSTCPQCGSKCTVKASGLHRKMLFDEAYFTYWMKSAIDPEAIVAIGTYAVRNYSGDYRNVKTQYAAQTLYVFQAGTGGSMFRRWAYLCADDHVRVGTFQPAKTVSCQFKRDHVANERVRKTYSRESLAAAVADTPFRYSAWELMDIEDMTKYMDLYSRYPCIEYLAKLGLGYLVQCKIDGERTYSTINWRGKTALQVLRLTKQELRDIQRGLLTMRFSALRLLQAGRKDGSNFTPSEAHALDTWYHDYTLDQLWQFREFGSLRQLTRYIARQQDKEHYRNPESVMRAWHDYLTDCQRLGYDLTDEAIVFPKNLYYAHQDTIRRIKYQKSELQDKEIKARLQKLRRYRFERDGLLIRPMESAQELIDEGSELHHCVGRYVEEYAIGKTLILAVRRESEPDKPFYTVEVHSGRVTQCYGLRNCRATDEVQAFMDAFKAAKLDTKHEQEVAN